MRTKDRYSEADWEIARVLIYEGNTEIASLRVAKRTHRERGKSALFNLRVTYARELLLSKTYRDLNNNKRPKVAPILGEVAVQKNVVNFARSKGWIALKLQGESVNGFPDYTFMRNGKILFIEFKAPGKKPTTLQEVMIEKLRSEGFTVYVIDDIERGRAIFAE